MRLTCLYFSILCFGIARGAAQDRPHPPAAVRRWTLAVSAGVYARSPQGWRGRVSNALIAGGYGGEVTACSEFFGCRTTTYPYVMGRPMGGWAVSLSYAQRAIWEVRALFVRQPDDGAVQGSAFGVFGDVTMFAVIAAWTPGPFRLGAGPALLMAHWGARTFSLETVGQSNASPLGLVVDTGLRSSNRVFLDLDVQYRRGSATAGPFQSMAATRVALDQLRAGVGLGVRF